jgi:hypothetical protein
MGTEQLFHLLLVTMAELLQLGNIFGFGFITIKMRSGSAG